MTAKKSMQNLGRQKKYRELTCNEIAAKLQITQAGVAKLEENAMKKLRKSPTLFLAYLDSIQKDNQRSNNVGTLTPDEMLSNGE